MWESTKSSELSNLIYASLVRLHNITENHHATPQRNWATCLFGHYRRNPYMLYTDNEETFVKISFHMHIHKIIINKIIFVSKQNTLINTNKTNPKFELLWCTEASVQDDIVDLVITLPTCPFPIIVLDWWLIPITYLLCGHHTCIIKVSV